MLSESGQQVVYWFGAGASAKALPVVDVMPDALNSQADQLRRVYGPNLQFKDEIAQYEKNLRNLASLSIAYGTLDTYARALYLQGDKSAELASLKLHLSMFFVLAPVVMDAPPPVVVVFEEYRARYDLDPRYMGWLALLLGDGLKLNPRVKAISWNYDFQVELALGRYCNPGALDQVHERYLIYPPPSDVSIDEANFFLTHLNGMAGQEKRAIGYHPQYRVYAGVFPAWINGLLGLYGHQGTNGKNFRSGFADRMTFAWERSPVAERAIELAMHALRKADVLVIVGYSFPAFNRLIDNRLIAAFDDGPTQKKLVLQNPNASRDDFLNLFRVDQGRLNITIDTNPDQFHLPNELFSEPG